jgi:glycosyltransferase involved in cell wall biosynthesis
VVIPAYNAADTIAATIESVLAQTYRPVEVLAIDDGSTDQTWEIIRSYGDRVRAFQQANAGPAAARNTGLRESKGELIAFLDADDRWFPEKLSIQWQALLQQPSVGLVHSDVIFFDVQTDRQWQSNVGRHRFVGKCTRQLMLENRILASSVLVRRKYLNRSGEFDEQFKGVEDYDLWLRLSLCCEFAYVDRPLVWYRQHAESLSANSTAMRMGELKVVQKALANLRELNRAPGDIQHDRKIRHRLRDLNWDVGYDAYRRGNYSLARRHLGNCLTCDPLNCYAAMLWCSTWFPKSCLTLLRNWKKRIAAHSGMASIP